MSVICICGLPGSGKTLFATYLARKSYKKQNTFLCKFKNKGVHNNIYSNYPIKLDKNNFSRKISLWDLDKYYKWDIGSSIIIDEIQLYFDSLDYKTFPKTIRNNFQLHRHYGIDNIYILSQHPSRIVKQLRVLACEFYDVIRVFKIPLTPWAILRYNIYYNYEDFGKSTRVKKEDVSYKFSRKLCLFNYKKVYKSYSTVYMYNLVRDNTEYFSQSYTSKSLDLEDIIQNFQLNVNDFNKNHDNINLVLGDENNFK